MNKAYDFDKQIKMMNQIFQSNISLAQNANFYLKNMSLSLIKKAVKQLKESYQEQFLKKDEQKYYSIRYTLNLIVTQKVTNVDELFMELGFFINDYYSVKYIDIRKKIPYFKKCIHCQQNVSNYNYGVKVHQIRCNQKQKINKTASIKKLELVEYSKENQCSQNELESKKEKGAKSFDKESKKQTLIAKRSRKRQQICSRSRKIMKEQAYRGFMNFDQYDKDMQLLEHINSQDAEHFISSVKTLATEQQLTVLDFQKTFPTKKQQS